MQALAALGWTGPQLGERLGVPAGEIARMQRWTRPVYAVTAARVAAVYDDLAMRRPAPWTWVEERCARIARDRNGWLPPLAYDDDEIDDPSARPYVGTVHGDDMDKAHLIDAVAVAEAVAGRRVGLTVQERRQAVHQLTQQGLSAREIGERLGVTGRAVVRGRSAA